MQKSSAKTFVIFVSIMTADAVEEFTYLGSNICHRRHWTACKG